MKQTLRFMKTSTHTFTTTYKTIFLTLILGMISFMGWGQTVTIGSGTNTGYLLPVNSNYGYTYSQQIVLQSEIANAGSIEKLRFYMVGGISLSSSNNWTIYMGHTSKTTFSSNTDWVSSASLTQVFSGTIASTPVAGWYEISLNTPFAYNNSDNLVVAVDENASGYNGSTNYVRIWTTPVANRGIHYRSDSTNPNPASPPTASGRTSYINQMQLEFASSVPPSCTSGFSPTDLATNVYKNATLSWNSASGATSYDVYFGASSPAAFIGNQSGLTYNPGVMSTNTTYYWKVIPKNANGSASGCSEISFTTGSDVLYCSSVPTSNDGSGITNVLLSSTNFPTTDVTYYFHSSPVINLPQGLLANCDITFATGYEYDTNIWIDFNDDGDFVDVGEQVFDGVSTSSNPTTLNADFTIPSGATLGQHRMRIGSADDGQATPNPCYSGTYGVTLDFNINVTAPPSCLPPTSLTATSITNNSASIGWTAGGSETLWNIELGFSGFTPTGTPSYSGVTNPYLLTSLTGNQAYSYYVQADCGGSGTSSWSGPYTFTTNCDPITTFPFTETFEAASTTIACWRVQDGNADGDTWALYTGYPHNGTQHAGIYTDYNSSNQDYLITPQFTLDGGQQLKFWVRARDASEPDEISVKLSGTNTAISSFTTTIMSSTAINFTTYTEYTIDISAYTGNYYIAFVRENAPANGWYLYLDDVTVEDIPTCFAPTALAASSITNNAATFGWTAPTSAPADGYDIYYSTTSTAPNGSTTPTVENNATTSYNATGLTAATTYYWWVRSDCSGGDTSTWASGGNFTTLCDPIASLPWTENFDAVTIPAFPTCWLKQNGDWVTTNNANSSYDADAHSGTQFLRNSWSATNEYMWTPGFTLDASKVYNFKFYWAGDAYDGWTGDVFVNSTQNSSGATQLGSSFVTSSETTTTTYQQETYSFQPSTTGTYYFAIRVNATSDPWYISFDDFLLEEGPTDAVDWQNLQWPGSGTLEGGETYTVFARVFEPGVTDSPGEGTAVDAWIGYSTSNSNPQTWTNWIPATYYGDDGTNNDEYSLNLGATLTTPGTYYYASRFQINGGPYRYGGYEATDSDGNGTWDGTADVSGVVTVTAPVADWYNLQWPANGTINYGDTFNVYAQAYEDGGVTAAAGQATGLQAWIGYSTSDTDPSTWTNWVVAPFDSQQGNNDQFMLNLGGSIPAPGTYYYASRFRYNNGAYTYGGYNGGAWNGTSNVNGVLTVNAYPGDLCSNPIALTVGGYFDDQDITATLANMSGSSETPNPSCAGFSAGDKDIWFSVVVPSSGTITIESRSNTGSTLTDTGMQVYSGTCGALTAVECDDDDSLDGAFSSVSLTGRTPSETLLVRVWDYLNSHFDTFKVSAYTCSGGTTTWDGTVWDNGAPDAGDATVFNGNFTMSTSLNSCNCTVNSGFTLTIPADMTYTVNSKITNNGTIDVAHEGSLLQVDGLDQNTGSGIYIIRKNTRAYHEYDYNYWASPVVGETVQDAFGTNSALLAGTGSTSTNLSYVYHMNPANFDDADDNGWDDNTDEWIQYSSGTMQRGKGYIALGAGADFPFNASDFENGFQQSVHFDGTNVNNGTFTLAVVDDIDTSTTLSDNLIGNPYPSALDANLFYSENSALIGQTAYLWSHDTGVAAGGGPWAYNFTNADYATLNMSTGDGTQAHPSDMNSPIPSQYIASGQGFIVQTTGAGNVTFKNDMRISGDNDHFMRMSGNQNDAVWVNMTAADGLFRQLMVGFYENADEHFDSFDSKRMPLFDEADFYSIPVGSNEKLVIQGLPEFSINRTVPLGVTIVQAGTYELSIDQLRGIFTEGQKVYVEDTYLNIIHNLTEGPYTFNSAVGTEIEDRFILRFTSDALDIDEDTLSHMVIYPNPSKGQFYFNYRFENTADIVVYDLTGKKLSVQTTNLSDTNHMIDLSQYPSGVYYAKITDGSLQTTKKLMVE